MMDFLNGLGGSKYFFIFVPIFFVVYYVAMFVMRKNKKNNIAKWLEENPSAVKVFLNYNSSLVAKGFTQLSVSAVDEEVPMLFSEKMKMGFYVLPGTHVVTSTYMKSRPGVLYKKVTTTYGPTKQEITVEASKTYDYSFDSKTEAYSFKEITV